MNKVLNIEFVQKKPFRFVLKFFKFYLYALLGTHFLTLLLLLFKNEHNSFKELLFFFYKVCGALYNNLLFWFALVVPTLVLLYFFWIIGDFRKSIKTGLINGLILKIILPSLLVLISLSSIEKYRLSENFKYEWNFEIENKTSITNNFYALDQKQRGIHFFRNSNNIDDIDLLVKNNFEWITLTPFISQENYNTPSLEMMPIETLDRFDKRYKALKKQTKLKGIKIMLKPHIWLNTGNNGKFRSDINMQNEEDWVKWFDNYKSILLEFAKLAEKHGFEQFCVGTELEKTATQKPQLWIELISEIRQIYNGNLVYAANWYNEFKDISFWDELDYIGIQAYFPLSSDNNPTLDDLEESWKRYIPEIESLSKRYNKPVIFTEIGYRSISGTAQKPWKWVKAWDYFFKISKKEQFLCYQSFFNTVWKEDWFHGIHIWEWQGGDDTEGNNTSFTIRSKPALNLIAERFNYNQNIN